MSPFFLLRARNRAVLVVSICAFVMAFALVWANGQRATNRINHATAGSVSTGLFLPDKGVITPQATITVNNPSDVANSSDGLCTLREAITAANSNAASGVTTGECAAGSSSGSDLIYMLAMAGNINLTAALPDISSNMTIAGSGSSQLFIRRSTAGFYRIFNIASGTVEISGLTVRDGRTADNASNTNGAGIQNLGTLTLNDVIVTSNQTGANVSFGGGGSGGGIFNQSTLTMANCSVSGNSTAGGVNSPGSGGGVYNAGTLTMTNCVVSGNTTGDTTSTFDTAGRGGGIFNSAAMTLISTTISNNLTGNSSSIFSSFAGHGGGIYNATTQSGFLVNCTVSGNTTGAGAGTRGYGGGIDNETNMTIVGSTISGNDGNAAGGILNRKTLIITNTTISGNTSAGINNTNDNASAMLTSCTVTANGSNGLVGSGVPTFFQNTIVAGNGGSDVTGPCTSLGHNLIGNPGSSTGFTNGVNGDQVGSSASPLNPQLRPLANNGGLTATHALLSTSPALDAGDDCVTQPAHCNNSNISTLTTDQRGSGFSRIVDGPDVDTTATVDIGAYEMQTPLANLLDTSTNEDTQLIVAFDGGDTSTITSVTASSSDPAVVPNDAAHLSVAMTGSTGMITVNPAANLPGTTNITVTVNRTGGPESKTFILTVNPVNDAPSFNKGPDQTVNEDAGAQTVTNWATSISPGPADESGQLLTFQVTGNTNGTIFTVGPAISAAGTLTYTPRPDFSGSATITINLKDNGGTANGGVDTSASQTFTITVNAVNDVPSFTRGPDQAVNEDAGAQTVNSWATSVSPGPVDENVQTLTFQVTGNTNAALFSSGPAINAIGNLTYTPAANANGSATITINLKDNGGTANGGVDTSAAQTFTITVNSVNDVPSFTKGANQTVNEDAVAQTVNNWATSISAGPADESGQTVSFNITNNTNAALFSAAPAVNSTGTLTYTPAANANGSATMTINVQDNGGTANGGVDTSAAQTFTITVNSVNDAPSFTKGADQTVNNNAGGQTVINWATAIAAGPTNESAQTLTFQITNNTNSSLFSAGPTVSPAGTLAYFPASNAGGTATITIRLQDNGGTANGGVDTSASQTFNITVIPAGGFIDFSAASYNTTESSGFTTVTVQRAGDLTRAITVDYASSGNNGLPCSTANGVATPKCDFTTALGTLSFAAGEGTKTVNILVSQDGFVEGPETFTVALSNPTNNAALGTSATSTTTIADDATEPAPPANVIDDARNFVRQHYHDFLNREPDQSGWDFWTNQITSCGSDVQCNEVRRIDVSASFFLSIEFQQTGYLVERFYKTAYGDATGTSNFVSNHQLNVPVVRFSEFLKDTQRIGQGVIVLAPGWEQALENNKQAYALEFVQTTRFATALPTTLTPDQFVDRLNQNTGGVLTLSERTTAINLFGGAANSSNVNARAQAVRMVADDTDLYNAEFNRAFVLAEYFGYLRRNPNDAPESTLDYTGYDFWLTKLNQFNGNYINAEMVKAFLSSIEYRQRFGP